VHVSLLLLYGDHTPGRACCCPAEQNEAWAGLMCWQCLTWLLGSIGRSNIGVIAVLGGGGLLHVDMFAHNKSGIAYQDVLQWLLGLCGCSGYACGSGLAWSICCYCCLLAFLHVPLPV
jgi:hypothetical protein